MPQNFICIPAQRETEHCWGFGKFSATCITTPWDQFFLLRDAQAQDFGSHTLLPVLGRRTSAVDVPGGWKSHIRKSRPWGH